jgi:hypothetical protein
MKVLLAIVLSAASLAGCAGRVVTIEPRPVDPVAFSAALHTGAGVFAIIQERYASQYQLRVARGDQPQPDRAAFCRIEHAIGEAATTARGLITVYASIRVDEGRRIEALNALTDGAQRLLMRLGPELELEALLLAETAVGALQATRLIARREPLPIIESPAMKAEIDGAIAELDKVIKSVAVCAS